MRAGRSPRSEYSVREPGYPETRLYGTIILESPARDQWAPTNEKHKLLLRVMNQNAVRTFHDPLSLCRRGRNGADEGIGGMDSFVESHFNQPCQQLANELQCPGSRETYNELARER